MRKAEPAFDVARDHGAGQAVERRVGDLERLILAANLDDGDHGAEQLVLGDRHVVGRIDEDMGRQDQPLRLTADDLAGPLGAPLLDVLAELLQLVVVDHRPNNGIVVARVADLQATHPVSEATDEILMDSPVDDDAVDAHADLALVQELAEDRRVHREVQVGVFEHDERGVPSELQLPPS